jgi:hypothetical protein
LPSVIPKCCSKLQREALTHFASRLITAGLSGVCWVERRCWIPLFQILLDFVPAFHY